MEQYVQSLQGSIFVASHKSENIVYLCYFFNSLDQQDSRSSQVNVRPASIEVLTPKLRRKSR